MSKKPFNKEEYERMRDTGQVGIARQDGFMPDPIPKGRLAKYGESMTDRDRLAEKLYIAALMDDVIDMTVSNTADWAIKTADTFFTVMENNDEDE